MAMEAAHIGLLEKPKRPENAHEMISKPLPPLIAFDAHGMHPSAEDVHAMFLANLDGEFCVITTTKDVLGVKAT